MTGRGARLTRLPTRDNVAARVRWRVPELAVQLVILIVLVGSWHLVSTSGLIPRILMPPPFEILERIVETFVDIVSPDGFILHHVLVTLWETTAGFFIAVVAGVGLGALVTESNWARVVLMPYLVAFNATPRIALAPILLIWLGFGLESKIVIAAVTAVFPIFVGTISGLNATETPALRLMRAYGATRWQTFRKLRLYNAAPYIFAGLETAVIFAIIGAVVAEFIAGSEGLGYLIVVSQESLDLPFAFSTLIILSLIGVILHKLVQFVRRRMVYWMAGDEDLSAEIRRVEASGL